MRAIVVMRGVHNGSNYENHTDNIIITCIQVTGKSRILVLQLLADNIPGVSFKDFLGVGWVLHIPKVFLISNFVQERINNFNRPQATP